MLHAWRGRPPLLLAFVLTLVGLQRVAAQEFLIEPEARLHDLATSGDGIFLVVWQSTTSATPGVRARRLLGNGQPFGAEMEVSPPGAYTQDAAAAVRSDGDFVVVWQSTTSGWYYGEHHLLGRRFGRGGRARPTFEIAGSNGYAPNDSRPAIAVSGAGDFVVVWERPANATATLITVDVFAQMFDRSGIPLGDTFRVNRRLEDHQEHSAVAMTDIGFVVVWESFASGLAPPLTIGARCFSSDGTPLGGEILVSAPAIDSSSPDVASRADGSFVVVWESVDHDGEAEEIFARRFDRDCRPLAGEVLVNTYTRGAQHEASIAMASTGDFFVAWTSTGQDGSDRGVFGQRFDPDGDRVGPEIQVNIESEGSQFSPRVAMSADTSVLVAWQSGSIDQTRHDIVGRRLEGESGGGGAGGSHQDRDDDGVPDSIDNCPTLANPDQLDDADDGFGDACVAPDAVIAPSAQLGFGPIVGAGSVVAEGVAIGDGARIGEFVRLLASMRAGDGLTVADLAVIGPRSNLGNGVRIGESAQIEGNVSIGDRVAIGDQAIVKRGAVVESDAVVGPLAIVFQGARIGRGATVEMGARVGRRAVVRPGAVVPAGTTVPPGSVVP